jgi:hypothetical protein
MKMRDYNTDHSVAFTRDEIASALSKLDPSCDRGEWIKIGMATKSAGEDLFDVWNEWSKGSEKHNQSDAASAWKSFREAKLRSRRSSTWHNLPDGRTLDESDKDRRRLQLNE